jgi:two-component system OmpR family sensor kinase
MRVLVSVVVMTALAFALFDLVAVVELHGYMITRTDSGLSGAAHLAETNLKSSVVRQATVSRKPVNGLDPTDESVIGRYSIWYVPDNATATTVTYDQASYLPVPVADLRKLATQDNGNGGIQTFPAPEENELRALAQPETGGMLVLIVDIVDVNTFVDQLRLILIVGSIEAEAAIALGVFAVLRRGFRPLETITKQADRITAGDLTERVIQEDPSSEVGRLGTALNGMLARIETSVRDREADQELKRRFFADASHELRTPLASLRANAELYQQGAVSEREDVDEVMRRITLEAQRMSRLLEDMMRLARLGQRPEREHGPVELSELVTGCVERARITAPARRWHAEIAGGVTAVGDAEQLRRAVDNLLANVVTHTPETTETTVTLRQRDGLVTIEVSDDGTGVTAEQLPHLFDRFYRGKTAGARPGAGLGLAIVFEIAAAHDGTVQAEPNEPHGLRISITLPTRDNAGFTSDSHTSPAAV